MLVPETSLKTLACLLLPFLWAAATAKAQSTSLMSDGGIAEKRGKSEETTPFQDAESASAQNTDIQETKEESLPKTPQNPSDPLTVATERFRVKFGLSGAVQPTGGIGSWWNLSESFAPDAAYKPDRLWNEGWMKASMTTDFTLSESLALYSGLSYVGSGNLGRDVFEQGNQGIIAVEDAFLGTRFANPAEELKIDVSYGRQPYKVGSGMLLSVGALNGFERGATTSFARRAWEEAGLIKLQRGTISWDGFYLNPNELRSGDTFTRLAGTKVETRQEDNQSIGLAYFNVFESEYPYAAAPLQLIPQGREGLNTMHTYMQWNPAPLAIPGFYIAGDYAYQWNERIAMSSHAFSGELGTLWSQLPWTPKSAYTFRSFQGDDPSTSRFEKFDPLFYEGSPALWASGSNGSFSFLNSNVQVHRIQLSINPTQRDTISFYYWHLRADQTNSPLQFGQAGRIVAVGGEPQLVSGVPDSHLSDDFYLEHFRMLNPNWFLTTGGAVSVPGRGLRALVNDPTTWYGGIVSLAFQY
jgi:hypothetical protein